MRHPQYYGSVWGYHCLTLCQIVRHPQPQCAGHGGVHYPWQTPPVVLWLCVGWGCLTLCQIVKWYTPMAVCGAGGVSAPLAAMIPLPCLPLVRHPQPHCAMGYHCLTICQIVKWYYGQPHWGHDTTSLAANSETVVGPTGCHDTTSLGLGVSQ